MRWLQMVVLACAAAGASACSSSSTSSGDAGGGGNDASTNTDTGAVAEAGGNDAGTEDAGGEDAAMAAATFTMVYSDIISPICAMACHNPSGIGVSMGHLDMSTQSAAFMNLVGTATMGTKCGGMGTRVVAGNADNSIMYKKVDPAQGAPCGDKMPLGGTPLSNDQANEIESWINAGAMND